METTLPARTAASTSAGTADVSSHAGLLPAAVQEAICAVPSKVSKADLAGPLLTKLVSLWSDDAGHLLREENLHGKVRKKHLAKEIGYRRRIRHGVPATEATSTVHAPPHPGARDTSNVSTPRTRIRAASPATKATSPMWNGVWAVISSD